MRKNQKNILSSIYRPSRGDQSMFTSNLNNLIKRYKQNKKNRLSCVFPVINGPTRITKASATAIDHIFTNTILDFEVQSGKIKTDIIDHFGIFCLKDSFKKEKKH